VDEAMFVLSRADRDAVALRFLKGMSLAEVGAAMGISENAARKRVAKALTRLRKILTHTGAAPSAALIGTHLAAHAIQPAPAHLAAMIAGGAIPAASSSAGVIAAHAARTMYMLKIKFAAAIAILMITLAAGGFVFAWRAQSAVPAPTPPPSFLPQVPAVAAADPGDQDEKIPETLHIGQWAVILNEAGADLVQTSATPVATGSVRYAVLRASGEQLRAAVAEAKRRGDVEISQFMALAVEQHVWDGKSNAQSVDIFGTRTWSRNFYTPDLQVYSSFAPADVCRVSRLDDRHLRLELNSPNARAIIQESNPANGSVNVETGLSLRFDGALQAGDAVATLVRYKGTLRKLHCMLIVWEAFDLAEDRDLDQTQERFDSLWWCQNGPQGIQQLRYNAAYWAMQAAHEPSQVAPEFEVKLEDGKIARLVGLTRPNRWWSCWWDAQGNPVDAVAASLTPAYTAASSRDLWVCVDVANDADLDHGRWNSVVDHIHDRASTFDVGIPVGPWIELARMKPPQTLKAGGVTYQLAWSSFATGPVWTVNWNRSGVLDDQDNLIAVGASGNQQELGNSGREIQIGRDLTWQNDSISPGVRMSPSDVQYFRLMHRKRQWITFADFATEPNTPPRTDVTLHDIERAKTAIWQAQHQKQVDVLRANQATWNAIVADQTTARGTVKLAMSAIDAGNENNLLSLMRADPPRTEQDLRIWADCLVRSQSAWKKVVARYGQQFYDDKIGDWTACHDIESEVITHIDQWKQRPDGAWFADGIGPIARLPDGKYHLVLDASADVHFMRTMIGISKGIDRLLATNPPLPSEIFVVEINRLAK
ncbi:MAG TPA: sigma factor-like helix-turn-helix DNA-binding protein, partial [Tepidisphaeraceae bacterium]|nr:sigma factor-like helix-turn-helix DNA-binding protein [Tepidisphaeraceae bacterium]